MLYRLLQSSIWPHEQCTYTWICIVSNGEFYTNFFGFFSYFFVLFFFLWPRVELCDECSWNLRDKVHWFLLNCIYEEAALRVWSVVIFETDVASSHWNCKLEIIVTLCIYVLLLWVIDGELFFSVIDDESIIFLRDREIFS